jgi:hypothetical protein
MVEIVLSVAVFLLTVAVIGLFAMMGELSSRLPDPGPLSGPDGPGRPVRPSTVDGMDVVPHPHPVPEARLGAGPAEWPPELAAVRDAERAHVVVFGSTCVTCQRIAGGETGPLDALTPPLAVVVSCPLPKDGTEFLRRHPMVTDYPHLIDVGGSWLQANFDMNTSPSVLVFEHGKLRSAYTFTSAQVLSQLPATA